MLKLSNTQIDTFNKCEKKWSYRYIDKLEVEQDREHLDFGTAYHAALEYFYSPENYKVIERGNLVEASVAEFSQQWQELNQKSKLDFDKMNDLLIKGQGMLRHWFSKDSLYLEKHYEPYALEQKFELEIDGVLLKGAIDMILRDKVTGKLVLVDWKTAKKIDSEDEDFRQIDSQIVLYCWVMTQLFGDEFSGKFLYIQHAKSVPEPPQRLKSVRAGCSFSVARTQSTTYEMYISTVSKEDTDAYNRGCYSAFLQWLIVNCEEYFYIKEVKIEAPQLQRFEVELNQNILDLQRKLGGEVTKRSQEKYKCGFCDYKNHCISDYMRGR